jgi:hypothetical protein
MGLTSAAHTAHTATTNHSKETTKLHADLANNG